MHTVSSGLTLLRVNSMLQISRLILNSFCVLLLPVVCRFIYFIFNLCVCIYWLSSQKVKKCSFPPLGYNTQGYQQQYAAW